MLDFDTFKTHIRALGKQRSEAVARKRDEQSTAMADEDAWRTRFDEIAGILFTQIIEPRLSFVPQALTSVTYEPAADTHRGTLHFNQDERYAASARLHVHVEPDGHTRLALVARPEIIPLLVRTSATRLGFCLDDIDVTAAADFVENSVLHFLDTYETFQDIPGYQTASRAKDPVCGMELNRADAVAKEKYSGRTFYFCVTDCHRRFLADPELFARHREH